MLRLAPTYAFIVYFCCIAFFSRCTRYIDNRSFHDVISDTMETALLFYMIHPATAVFFRGFSAGVWSTIYILCGLKLHTIHRCGLFAQNQRLLFPSFFWFTELTAVTDDLTIRAQLLTSRHDTATKQDSSILRGFASHEIWFLLMGFGPSLFLTAVVRLMRGCGEDGDVGGNHSLLVACLVCAPRHMLSSPTSPRLS